MSVLTRRDIAVGGVIGAVYLVLSLVFAPISFAVYQVRIAESLTVLPYLTRAAIPGLFIGCALANVIGGMGWMDIVFGSLITLVASFLTRLIGRSSLPVKSKRLLAPLPPVLLNAFGVSLYLAPLIGVNYWFSVQMVGLGQVISCYVLGLPLLVLLERRRAKLF